MKYKKGDCLQDRPDYPLFEKNGVTYKVRDLQLEVLSIMDEIDRVCRKNDIKYFLIAGSAIGAVNYQGFVPWDDDIDVAVNIDDWPRFIEALKKDLGENFYFDCWEIDKRFNTINGPWMKIRKRGTYIEESNTLLKNRCKRGNGIFVDIIPYGGIAKNKFIDEVERTIVKINMLFIVLLDNLHINPIPFKAFVHWFSKKCMKWHKNSPLVSQPVSVPWEKFLHEPVFKKEDVYPVEEYYFEGRKFYSYKNIEKILTEWYGYKCVKKWDGEKWINLYPMEKRKPKHTKDLNLNGECSISEK